MMSLIIGIGVVLVLTILYLIFRVSRLVSIAKGKQQDEVSKNNGVHGTLFMVTMIAGLGAFFWYSWSHFDSYNLPVASIHGEETDMLFWVSMAVVVAAFVIITIIMFVFTYQYKYDPNRKAKFYPDNHYLELAWTIIPAIVLSLLIFTGLRSWNDITSPASADK